MPTLQLRGASIDIDTARHACIAMQRAAAAGPLGAKAERTLLNCLEGLMLRAPPLAQAHLWYAMAEQAAHEPDALTPPL